MKYFGLNCPVIRRLLCPNKQNWS